MFSRPAYAVRATNEICTNVGSWQKSCFKQRALLGDLIGFPAACREEFEFSSIAKKLIRFSAACRRKFERRIFIPSHSGKNNVNKIDLRLKFNFNLQRQRNNLLKSEL